MSIEIIHCMFVTIIVPVIVPFLNEPFPAESAKSASFT